MDRKRLSKLKGSLDVFLAKRKKKIILFHRFESKKEPKEFQKLVSRAITKQGKAIITISLIEDALALVEKADDALNKKILALLKKAWKPITKYLDESKTLAFMVWSGNQGGQMALELLGADGTFKLKNSKILDVLKDNANYLLDSMDDTSMNTLRVAVTNGIKKDMTPKEIQESIHAKLEDEVSPYRAEMITRTEFANAAGIVAKKSYEELGVEEWTWSQPPEDEDDICTDNDGETRVVGDSFPSGDDNIPAHPNCKCDLIPEPPKGLDLTGAWLGD